MKLEKLKEQECSFKLINELRYAMSNMASEEGLREYVA